MAESAEQEKLLKRINELAHKNKKEGLTEAETRERSNIEMMRIYDKEGNEVTPEKVREVQRKKGLRDD